MDKTKALTADRNGRQITPHDIEYWTEFKTPSTLEMSISENVTFL